MLGVPFLALIFCDFSLTVFEFLSLNVEICQILILSQYRILFVNDSFY